jgi:hypothetical protein
VLRKFTELRIRVSRKAAPKKGLHSFLYRRDSI